MSLAKAVAFLIVLSSAPAFAFKVMTCEFSPSANNKVTFFADVDGKTNKLQEKFGMQTENETGSMATGGVISSSTLETGKSLNFEGNIPMMKMDFSVEASFASSGLRTRIYKGTLKDTNNDSIAIDCEVKTTLLPYFYNH